MFRRLAILLSLGLFSFGAQAIPALQLGPGDLGIWSYDTVTDTWVVTSPTFTLEALANSDGTDANGDYAWDLAGSVDQYAYLVVSATPKQSDATDVFTISISNDGGLLSLYDFGFGSPPLNDPNSSAPHGIFDTYFEIYEFQFDDTATTIGNTEPGKTGMGEGYSEIFDVTVNSLALGALGVHFDLFTSVGARWNPSDPDDKKMVNAIAPFSHDAQYVVPVPAAFWLFGTALIGFIGISRRRSV